jgi:signal transduction histidine kinase
MDNRISTALTENANNTSTNLKVYQDKDGLPVIFNTDQNSLEKQMTPDELSILWHEILSPLTVIKGYTSTLLDLDHNITEEQKKKYLQGIESASNRMLRVLDNLRSASQFNNSDCLKDQLIFLPDVIQHAIIEIQHQTSSHKIMMLPSERLSMVRADPDKIEQVLINLIQNAVKYSPRGGEIEVIVRIVSKEVELRDIYGNTPHLKLPSQIVCVIDHGIGIPEKDLKRVFERFYRVNNETTNSTPGSGLGLYISKLIIESHGGSIWAGNNPSGGSIFNFSLPLRD